MVKNRNASLFLPPPRPITVLKIFSNLTRNVNQNNRVPQRWLRPLKRMNLRNGVVFAGIFILAAGLFAATLQRSSLRQPAALLFSQTPLAAFPEVPEALQWGLQLSHYQLTETELHQGDVLGEILMKHGLTYPQVAKLVENCRGKFNVSSMHVGKPLHFLTDQSAGQARFMVYEPSPYEYAVFQLTEPFETTITKREVETKVIAASGVLETSFWQALTDNGLNDELADGMIDILASSVDFYHQRQGDRFKVVFEQHYVEGKAVGTGNILAALYEREGKQYYAFHYDKPNERTKYFDAEGRPARKAFLKAPVKFSRISSRYSLNRMHPILGYCRPHLGTDFAAPYGTPIMAVAEGTVLEATRRGGNGNFVKIRHDGIYQTQYLHMSSFAKGIHPGAHVGQGQTIGYVGATGLATGPHCCFRFWKNNKEVDPLKLDLPSPDPMKGADFQAFVPVRDQLMQMLNGVVYHSHDELSSGTKPIL